MDDKNQMSETPNFKGMFEGATMTNCTQNFIWGNETVHVYSDGKQAKDVPLTVTDKDIKSTLEALLREKDQEGKLLFKNKKQWWAVYRVLSTFCQYPKQMTAFKTKITDMEIDYGGNPNVITYESLTEGSKAVPQIAAISPSAWDTYKDISDNYKQQYVVAEYLMLKLGIKS